MTEHRRRLIARLLLAVFLPAFLAATLHTHEGAAATDTCMECVAHTPHAGHLSAGAGHLGDCLLCHFSLLSYFLAPMLTMCIVPPMVERVFCATTSVPVLRALLNLRLRAPPIYV